MNITSSVRVAKTIPSSSHALKSLTKSEHDIAWPDIIDKQVRLTGEKRQFSLPETPQIHTFSFANQHTSTNTLLNQDYVKLTQQGCALAKQCFPELLDQPIDGIHLLIASAEAYDTWIDKNTAHSPQSWFSTSKAFLTAFDVIEPFFPVLGEYKTHKQVAGLLLTMAESVYVVQRQHTHQ